MKSIPEQKQHLRSKILTFSLLPRSSERSEKYIYKKFLYYMYKVHMHCNLFVVKYIENTVLSPFQFLGGYLSNGLMRSQDSDYMSRLIEEKFIKFDVL